MYQVDKIKSPNWRKFTNANLPTKYIDHDISDFRILGEGKVANHNRKTFEQFMEYYNNAEEHLRKGEGLMLCGSVGIAKTWLMTHLAKKIISVFDDENGKLTEESLHLTKGSQLNRFYYIQATTLSQMVFPTGLNEKELNIRRGIKTIAGLWIDDISKLAETKSGHETSFLDDLLRWRDLNCLPSFYTSQLPFKDIATFSVPIHDIIRGNCKVLTFMGDSQR
jgi:DNA replication protein DnaC